MKHLFYAAVLFFTTYAYAGRNNLQGNIPPSRIGLEQAVSKVARRFGFDPAKEHMRLVAVVWSPLTCDPGKNPPFCYYVEPLTGRYLNMFLAGKPDEWSWFVTYMTPSPKTTHAARKFELSTYQVRENGEVISIASGH